jgi:hypothetical protein
MHLKLNNEKAEMAKKKRDNSSSAKAGNCVQQEEIK